MHLAKIVPKCLHQKIDAKEEDQRTNNGDGNVSNNDRTNKHDSKCSQSKQRPSYSTISTASHKQDGVGIYKVILLCVSEFAIVD